MSKTVVEKLSLGIQVTKEECSRTLAAYMSNLKALLVHILGMRKVAFRRSEIGVLRNYRKLCDFMTYKK